MNKVLKNKSSTFTSHGFIMFNRYLNKNCLNLRLSTYKEWKHESCFDCDNRGYLVETVYSLQYE